MVPPLCFNIMALCSWVSQLYMTENAKLVSWPEWRVLCVKLKMTDSPPYLLRTVTKEQICLRRCQTIFTCMLYSYTVLYDCEQHYACQGQECFQSGTHSFPNPRLYNEEATTCSLFTSSLAFSSLFSLCWTIFSPPMIMSHVDSPWKPTARENIALCIVNNILKKQELND